MIGQVACDILLLLCDHAEYLFRLFPELTKAVVEVKRVISSFATCCCYSMFLPKLCLGIGQHFFGSDIESQL